MVMPDDPATERDDGIDTSARRAAAAAAGIAGDEPAARRALADHEPAVRATALGALARMGRLTADDVGTASEDPSPVVRRRAATESVSIGADGPDHRDDPVDGRLRAALGDPDPLVAESACWALGERSANGAVDDLVSVARSHPDTRCREAAVAALGAIGDPAGLPGVLAGIDDKPTVRRRAAVALAAFEGPEVEAALTRCLDDRDWQVREVAEILRDA
jgi:HEAT repeat protein